MTDLAGKKITLMGLGLNGGAIEDALFFIGKGARLTITDLKTAKELKPSLEKLENCLPADRQEKYKINLTLGKHEKKDFLHADMVIKSPAIPNNSKYLVLARNNGVKVSTSMGLFFELANTKNLIGITGTKGKSTTAALIHKIIKTKYPKAYLAGNIGVSPLKYASRAQKAIGIIELSSFQLDDLKKSPHISVITNIAQDHLNRYRNFSKYIDAKKRIFKWQNKNDFLVINKNIKKIATNSKSKTVFFSDKNIKTNNTSVHPDNIAAAIEVAKILNISSKKYNTEIKNFTGLEGRLEYIGNINRTKIYNDTTATNPMSALNSIKNFEGKKLALIAGGEDKNLEYSEFSKNLKHINSLALLPGSASDKIYMYGLKNGTWNDKFKKVRNLATALEYSLQTNPEILLFSPAAASFNMFANEFDRGLKFKEAVKNYGAKRKKVSR